MFDTFFRAGTSDKGYFHWVPARKRKTEPKKEKAERKNNVTLAYGTAAAATFALWFLFYGADWINNLYRQSHLDAYRAKYGHEPFSWDMVPDRLVPDLSGWAHVYACIILLLGAQAIIVLISRHR